MRRPLFVACALALATAAPAAPASAEPLPDRCTIAGGPYPAGPEIDLDGDGRPEATLPNPGASVCVSGDSGLPDPAQFTCYGGFYDCDLRVTYGHTGTASAEAEVCADPGYGGGAICTTTDSGTVPLVPVEDRTLCVGWSLTTSCMPQHDD